MSDILDEIREDLFKEKFTLFCKKYAKYFIIILTLIILSSAFYVTYDNYRNNKELIDSENLYKIIDKYNNNDDDFFKYAENYLESNSDISNIVRLKKIQFDIKNKKFKDSYKALDNFIAKGNNDKILRDYAILLLNYVIYSNLKQIFPQSEKYDSINSDNIFYFSIVEIRALGYIEDSKFDLAHNELKKIITSDSATINNKEFAVELIELLKKSEKI